MAEQTINQEADKIIHGQRREDYGSALESFEKIAKLWSVILDTEITAHQVCLCMVQLKVARATKTYTRDSYVDIAGYAGCAEMIQLGLEKRGA
jgi:Domain of unknown function (DUF6378)